MAVGIAAFVDSAIGMQAARAPSPTPRQAETVVDFLSRPDVPAAVFDIRVVIEKAPFLVQFFHSLRSNIALSSL